MQICIYTNLHIQVKWDLEKFLIDENDNLIHRFRSAVKPLDPQITQHL